MTGDTTPAIMTIGHSNHTLERLVSLLRTHGATLVADVRSMPYSRRNTDFNREQLGPMLEERGITYVFLGDVLGARPRDPSCYADGRVQYRRLAERPAFRGGLRRLLTEAKTHRVVLFCAEKEPLGCHRAVLIARELEQLGAVVRHIHADGSLETHGEAVQRLMDEEGVRQLGLFGAAAADGDLLDQAYDRREEKIAYAGGDARDSG